MGRRLSVILGILLAMLASTPLARGQDEGQNGPPPAAPVPVPVPVPVDPKAPDPIPEDLRLPKAPVVGEADDLAQTAQESRLRAKRISSQPSQTRRPKTARPRRPNPTRESNRPSRV